MIIDYSLEKVFTQSLDIVDPGNTCIRATNKDNFEYYLYIKSNAGMMTILKYGPLLPDLEVLLNNFNLSYIKTKYSMKKIAVELNSFLNDPKKQIEAAEEITEFEAMNTFPTAETIFRGED